MSSKNKFKLDSNHTKNIIVNALDEHHNKINIQPDPRIENKINNISISKALVIIFKYIILYLLLTASTFLFMMMIKIDFKQIFDSPTLSSILFSFGFLFILLITCSLLSTITMKFYDKLVIKYTKFTRSFSIYTIFSIVNILNPSIFEFIKSFF